MQTDQNSCMFCQFDSNTSSVGPQESGNRRLSDLPEAKVEVIIHMINSPQTVARPGKIDS